jgi:polyhydroxyalkanoate synthesis regulator phasin
MDQRQIAKQMLQFNKTAFDNSFNAMTMVYEQNEKMVGTFLEQATWLPEEGKKAISEWMQSYKKGCEDFKKMVNENYEKVEAFFAGSGD